MHIIPIKEHKLDIYISQNSRWPRRSEAPLQAAWQQDMQRENNLKWPVPLKDATLRWF